MNKWVKRKLSDNSRSIFQPNHKQMWSTSFPKTIFQLISTEVWEKLQEHQPTHLSADCILFWEAKTKKASNCNLVVSNVHNSHLSQPRNIWIQNNVPSEQPALLRIHCSLRTAMPSLLCLRTWFETWNQNFTIQSKILKLKLVHSWPHIPEFTQCQEFRECSSEKRGIRKELSSEKNFFVHPPLLTFSSRHSEREMPLIFQNPAK